MFYFVNYCELAFFTYCCWFCWVCSMVCALFCSYCRLDESFV